MKRVICLPKFSNGKTPRFQRDVGDARWSTEARLKWSSLGRFPEATDCRGEATQANDHARDHGESERTGVRTRGGYLYSRSSNSARATMADATAAAPLPSFCAAALAIAKKSYCPKAQWMDELELLLRRRDMVFVNVGVNKGFNIAEFALRFGEGSPLHNGTATWQSTIAAVHIHGRPYAECGMCDACAAQKQLLSRREEASSIEASKRGVVGRALFSEAATYAGGKRQSVRAYGFDVVQSNVAVVQEAMRRLGLNGAIMHAAVTNHTGVVFGPPASTHFGVEQLGASEQEGTTFNFGPIKVAGKRKYALDTMLNATTVDDFAERERLHHISFLSIDTEGSDGLVLQGTRRLLERRRVDVLEFEYHMRAKVPLKESVSDLWGLGYECFWQGNSGALAPASGANWCDSFEFRYWSNLVCAQTPAILEVLRRLAKEGLDSPNSRRGKGRRLRGTSPPLSLERLAYRMGTDKSKDDHKYVDLYASLFDPIRDTVREHHRPAS